MLSKWVSVLKANESHASRESENFSRIVRQEPLLRSLFAHRSIRQFKPNTIIPTEHKEVIESAAQRAATSCSGQMYSFIEISDSKLRNALYKLGGKQQEIRDASLFYVVLGDLYRLDLLAQKAGATCEIGSHSGAMIAACDASLAAQNLVLAAEALGYGTVYIGNIGDQCDAVAALLGLPPRVIPLYGIAMGIPAENPPTRPRLDKELVFHRNKYSAPTEQQLVQAIVHMSQQLEEEGYYRKYTKRSNYTWRDHLAQKFGGKWLHDVEKQRERFIKTALTRAGRPRQTGG
jgi:FMN reductase (NADPH)